MSKLKENLSVKLHDLSLLLMSAKTKTITVAKSFFALRIVRIILILFFVVTFAPFILFFILRPKPQENINYGVSFSNKYATQLGLDWEDAYLKILDDLGAENLRLVAYWDDIEKVENSYNWRDIKWQLEEAEKRDLNVIMTIGRKVYRYPECFEPEWWRNIENEKVRNEKLYEYVAEAVKELKDYDSIKIWQVENEPFFPFGICLPIKKKVVANEVAIVRSLDSRPIIVQDSGEGGFWFPSYKLGDYLGISMYRKIWYNFWGVFFGDFIYFKYPLAHWTYKIKADLVRVPHEKIYVTELQAEPWGPGINSELTREEKNKTMSRHDFLNTISYAQKAGFKNLYLWGVEWWLWEKEVQNYPFYWDTAKALFN